MTHDRSRHATGHDSTSRREDDRAEIDPNDAHDRPAEPWGRTVAGPDQRVTGDRTETMVCAFRPWSVPRTFPVVHRPMPATRRLVEVASEPDRRLVCDSAHEGAHMWPTGEMVPDDSSLHNIPT